MVPITLPTSNSVSTKSSTDSQFAHNQLSLSHIERMHSAQSQIEDRYSLSVITVNKQQTTHEINKNQSLRQVIPDCSTISHRLVSLI